MYRGHFVCNTHPDTGTAKCTGSFCLQYTTQHSYSQMYRVILSAIHTPTQVQPNVQGSFCLQYTPRHRYSQMYRVILSAIHTLTQLQPNVQGSVCLQYTTQYSYTYSQMYRGHFVCNTHPNIVTLTAKCTGVILSAIHTPI